MKWLLDHSLKDTTAQQALNFLIKKKELIKHLSSEWSSEGNFSKQKGFVFLFLYFSFQANIHSFCPLSNSLPWKYSKMLHSTELSFEQISEGHVLYIPNTKGYFLSFKKKR